MTGDTFNDTLRTAAATTFAAIPLDMDALPTPEAENTRLVTVRAAAALLRMNDTALTNACREEPEAMGDLFECLDNLLQHYRARVDVMETAQTRLMVAFSRLELEDAAPDATAKGRA